MSNVSNRHNVNPFIAGKSAPLSGQVLLKAVFKQTATMTKKGIKALPSVCASVPVFPVLTVEQLLQAEPTIREYFDNVREKLLTARAVATKSTLTSIGDEELNLDCILAYLNATSPGHMTKEKIDSFYTACMVDVVTAFTIEKLTSIGQLNADATPEQIARKQPVIDATIKQWRDNFAMFASKTQPKECADSMIRFALDTLLPNVDNEDGLNDTDDIGGKLASKLEKWLAPAEVVAIADALDLTA